MKKYTAFLLSVLLVACSMGEQEGDAKAGGGMPPAAVTLTKPEVGNMVESLTIAGTLNANKSALISSEMAGIIRDVGVADGQKVKQGDLLFAINHDTQTAEVKRAEANVHLRQQEQKRMQSLFKRNSVSQYDVDKANAELLMSEADLEYAKAELRKAIVTAPFDGTVGIRQVNKGAYVQAGTPLIEIVELNPLYLDFAAPETVLSVMAVGDIVNVIIPAIRQMAITATITAIEPSVDALTRSIKIRASVNNDQGILRPGVFARVSLPVSTTENIMWLPEAALFYQDDKRFVMLNDAGKSLRREVKIAGFKEGKVAITSGVTAEDDVVVAGHHKLPFDGMPLLPVNPADEPEDDAQNTQTESP